MRRFRSSTAIAAMVAIGVAAPVSGASAATQQLDCVLTDIGTQPGSENWRIAIVFDDDAETLLAQDGAESLRFTSVSISKVSINGATDNASIGIDRSALGIVWQKYGSTGVVTEYGKCRQNRQAAARSTY